MENNLFLLTNPWLKNKSITIENYIPRNVYFEIIKYLFDDEIIILTGARQSGKTTIIYKIIQELLSKNINPKQIFYFNLDGMFEQEICQNAQSLFSFVRSFGEFNKYYLFLDEAQRLDLSLLVKQLHDLQTSPFKIFLSGSSSLQLKSKLKESLVGRNLEFTVFPLSLKELRPQAISWKLIQSLLGKIMIFGSYPKIYLEPNREKKILLLNQLYKDYLEKDIVNFLKIENTAGFNKLIALLSWQIGSTINKTELTGKSEIDIKTLNKYLQILEQTYVIKAVYPYFKVGRDSLVHNPKIYFVDLGLRNILSNQLQDYSLRFDHGQLWENLILSELLKTNQILKIYYWRLQSGGEVDFVVQDIQGKTFGLEVKAGKLNKPTVPRSARHFLEKTKIKKMFILNENLKEKVKIDQGAGVAEVEFLQIQDFMQYLYQD